MAESFYNIWFTCTAFDSTIYDGYRIPWATNHLDQAKTSSCIFEYFQDYPSYKALRIIRITYEACKHKSNRPSGQVYNYPTIRPDSSRQRRRRISTFRFTGKAKKWKHRISHQSSQTCALLLAYSLWIPADCAKTEGPNKFVYFCPNITDLNCNDLVISGLLASCLLVLIAFFLGRVSTVLKCWLKWQYAKTTVQQHQRARVAALCVVEIDPAVKRIRKAEAEGRKRRVLEARRLNRQFALSALQYRLAKQEWRAQPQHDCPQRRLLHDTTECPRKPKRAWEAVANEMTEVIDHFHHKQRFRPAVRELLHRLCIQPVSPPQYRRAHLHQPLCRQHSISALPHVDDQARDDDKTRRDTECSGPRPRYDPCPLLKL